MENKFTVEFYEKENGEKPCLLFLNTLEVKLRAKAFRDLKLLEEKGTELRLPYSEHLDDGIFELRTKQGTNIIRNLYFFFVGNKIIVTHSFRKKTQKTPRREIEKAKAERDDWIARKG
jgi:phage-related protein